MPPRREEPPKAQEVLEAEFQAAKRWLESTPLKLSPNETLQGPCKVVNICNGHLRDARYPERFGPHHKTFVVQGLDGNNHYLPENMAEFATAEELMTAMLKSFPDAKVAGSGTYCKSCQERFSSPKL